MKPTPWYPSDVSPVHAGYYEVHYAGEGEDVHNNDFLYWNGERWQYTSSLEQPPLWGQPGSGGEYWRGLSGRAQ